MNAATQTTTQTPSQVSGLLLHNFGAGGSLDSIAHRSSRASAAAFDLPSNFPLRGSTASSRRFERRFEPIAEVCSESDGTSGAGRGEPWWHKIVRRHPATVGVFCLTFPIAVIAQIAVMVHV